MTMNSFSYPVHLYPFKHRVLTILEHRIHYIDEGQGPVVLFCHPSIATSFMYRGMIQELSRNARCIALDFPGFGMSLSASGYIPSIASQAKVLDQFIASLGLGDIYLVMQEVGGHSAMAAFLQQPEWLKGLIITDTILFPCTEYPRIEKVLKVVNGRAFNFLNSNFNFLARAMTRFGIRKRKLSKEERQVYKQLFPTPSTRRTTTRMLHELLVHSQLLSEIQQALESSMNSIPVLIIYGDKDPLTEMGVPQRIHRMLPNSKLHWIKGEAHFPHEGAPVEMSRIIARWLTKVER